MVRTYRAHKQRIRHKTYRGGSIETVKKIITETPVGNVHIINPNSKFVVATYVWGIANNNANMQQPCPEDIEREIAIPRLLKIAAVDGIKFPSDLVKQRTDLYNIGQKRPLTTAEEGLKKELDGKWNKFISDLKQNPKYKEDYINIKKVATATALKKPGNRPPRTFGDMIREWEAKCEAAGVNYVQLNTEFSRQDYQNAINGKPLFIRKILDAVAPRGVLYIDGDMWINKYPRIFDMENVDFMARNWNIDSRSNEKVINNPYYDPYTFETSGGTMFFGNTKKARELLSRWENASSKQFGKADDRILSQVFTTESLVNEVNTVGLPIEYLWLTDNYKKYLKDESSATSVEHALIEHPYCLTGEERATSQGAASDRTPVGYVQEVEGNIDYDRPPELFYEYIFFDGDERMCEEYNKYNQYMSTSINPRTQNLMLNIVSFKNKYGDFNTIADQNLSSVLSPTTTSLPMGSLSRKTTRSSQRKGKVSLPMNTPIPNILKALYDGYDVELGGSVSNVQPEDDVVGFNDSKTAVDMYTRTIHLNTSFPIYISSKSKIMWHALAMCQTIADINKHIEGSYMFMSRIRWNLTNTPGPQKISNVILPPNESGFVPRVNQIWFGGDMPEWRKYMFNENKKICESNGFQYSLWKNEDRTEENFSITLPYQNDAIEIGKETGQNRWAQVADLARLEIIYNVGGIYIDSLFEITPAFLKAVTDAFKSGATFVGCNEDQCEPLADCIGHEGRKYLTNSFFAATKLNPILGRLLDYSKLDAIDLTSEYINRTTGPYYLREGIQDVIADKVFMFNSDQLFPFNQQETPYKDPVPNRFLSKVNVKGAVKVRDNMYYLPGGAELLQAEFLVDKKGPLAIYHSGLGGTWSM